MTYAIVALLLTLSFEIEGVQTLLYVEFNVIEEIVEVFKEVLVGETVPILSHLLEKVEILQLIKIEHLVHLQKIHEFISTEVAMVTGLHRGKYSGEINFRTSSKCN